MLGDRPTVGTGPWRGYGKDRISCKGNSIPEGEMGWEGALRILASALGGAHEKVSGPSGHTACSLGRHDGIVLGCPVKHVWGRSQSHLATPGIQALG